jgi:site-specific recombinase XerD
LEKAVKWGHLQENPLRYVKKPKAPESETAYFTPEDIHVLKEKLPTETCAQRRLRNMALLAYETGLRLGEIRFLERTAVDMEQNILRVKNTDSFTTKSKRHRSIPLSDLARKLIHDQLDDIAKSNKKVQESQYLFANKDGNYCSESLISNTFTWACREILPQREGLSFHSLRHGFGTRLALAGVAPQMIQKLMGHCSVTVTERYTHLSGLDFTPALDALNATR